MIQYILNPGQELTPEQLKEIEEAIKHPITFDEDCPELSPQLLESFKKATIERRKKKSGISES